MPPNLQTVSFKFARRRSAKVMGSLAERETTEPVEGEEVQGILVTHNFTSRIVKPEDLAKYTPLRLGSITSKLHVPFTGSIETLRLFFSEMFAGITEKTIEEDGKTCHIFSFHEDRVSYKLDHCDETLSKTFLLTFSFFTTLSAHIVCHVDKCLRRKGEKRGYCKMEGYSSDRYRCRCSNRPNYACSKQCCSDSFKQHTMPTWFTSC